ncbi:hypothetical protein CHARACLAT_029222, partial [Characodon lateralis]|nr:hypothetical protein [Characodon lateralis]
MEGRIRGTQSPLGVHKCHNKRRKVCILMGYVSSASYSQDYQHGIFQSIGMKEFHNYLTAPENSSQQEKDKLRDK